MKILHTSDWHLGQNFYNYDRDLEHRYFFSQLSDIVQHTHPDALVVSGDIFNTWAPNVQAQKLFVDAVIALHDHSPETVIVITAGNHDSGSRLEAERKLWHRLGVHVIGGYRRNEDGEFDPSQFIVDANGKGWIVAVPFFHPSNFPAVATDMEADSRQAMFFDRLLNSLPSDGLPVVMMAHLAVDGCNFRGHEDQAMIGGQFTTQLQSLGSGYDYMALGHIHMPQKISRRVYYSGSPIPLSFTEDYDHYINLVEIPAHGDEPQVEKIKINALRHVATIPADGAPLEEALQALADFDNLDNSYVRLLVDQDEPLAADAEDRARKATEGKQCLFCHVQRKPREVSRSHDTPFHIEDTSEFNRLKPIDIALHYYRKTNNAEMDPRLVALLNQAIDSANTVIS